MTDIFLNATGGYVINYHFTDHYCDRQALHLTVRRVCVCFSTAHLSASRLERSQPLISGSSSCGDVLEGLSLYFIEGL